MIYRKCLWCGDYFWGTRRDKCCCPEHQECRNKEKNQKSAAKRYQKKKKLKALLRVQP